MISLIEGVGDLSKEATKRRIPSTCLCWKFFARNYYLVNSHGISVPQMTTSMFRLK